MAVSTGCSLPGRASAGCRLAEGSCEGMWRPSLGERMHSRERARRERRRGNVITCAISWPTTACMMKCAAGELIGLPEGERDAALRANISLGGRREAPILQGRCLHARRPCSHLQRLPRLLFFLFVYFSPRKISLNLTGREKASTCRGNKYFSPVVLSYLCSIFADQKSIEI